MCLVYVYGIELLASTCKAVCTILSDVYVQYYLSLFQSTNVTLAA